MNMRSQPLISDKEVRSITNNKEKADKAFTWHYVKNDKNCKQSFSEFILLQLYVYNE